MKTDKHEAQFSTKDMTNKVIEMGLAQYMKGKRIVDDNDEEPKDIKDHKEFQTECDDRYKRFVDIWHNNGIGPNGKRVTIDNFIDRAKKRTVELQSDPRYFRSADAVSSPDNTLLLPRLVSEIIKEPIPFSEPMASLLPKINMLGSTALIQYPMMGSMGGQELDIGEGMEYPEGAVDMSGSTNIVIGKSGIAIRFSAEQIRYSMYPIFSLLFKQAKQALQRWKDLKIANHILGLGVTQFDNNDGSALNDTTGRDQTGELNGTLSVDDLFKTYANLVTAGFTPDTLIMHPMSWLIFARDPQMRHLAWWDGGNYFNKVQGNLPYAKQFESQYGALGGSLGLGGESSIAGMYNANLQGFPVPLRIVVSPSIPFTAASGTTPAKSDIIMCDSSQLGVIFVDEEPTSEQWDDPSRDMLKVKIRERYAIAIANDGQAVRTIKNVNITQSYDWTERLTWPVGTGGALPSGGYE